MLTQLTQCDSMFRQMHNHVIIKPEMMCVRLNQPYFSYNSDDPSMLTHSLSCFRYARIVNAIIGTLSDLFWVDLKWRNLVFAWHIGFYKIVRKTFKHQYDQLIDNLLWIHFNYLSSLPIYRLSHSNTVPNEFGPSSSKYQAKFIETHTEINGFDLYYGF